PSASALVHRNGLDVLYVTKSNDDSLGVVLLNENRKLDDVDLSLEQFRLNNDEHHVHGAYPNAIVASPSGDPLYVAEAGLNSVAVLDASNPLRPRLIGRIPTNWYPTALAINQDGLSLYILNAKGIGEDINPATKPTPGAPPTGLVSDTSTDSNYIFGSLQK